MAKTELITNTKLQSLFENLEAQKSLLTKCTDLYKTLTSHFTNLQNSIDSQTLTLSSDLKSLISLHQTSLNDLTSRESSIPEKLASFSSEIESKKQSAIAEVEKPLDENASFEEVVRSLCRRMDYSRLLKFMIAKRKEANAFRGGMGDALKECVDSTRMVLESVKEFVAAKAKVKRGTDMRWACAVVVNGLFPMEAVKERKEDSVGPTFATKTVEEAREVVREWRAKAQKPGGEEGGGGGSGKGKGSCMGSAEAVLFLQVVVGFGLKEVIEEEYCRNLVLEFADRRDMAKLAVPIFGDKMEDLINQLVKSGKEVEAVYFASESSLTDKFQPAFLLKSYLRESERKTAEILKKGNHNAGATDEANNFEMSYIKSIVRCVEDNKLEEEFSVECLRKRLSVLERSKAAKKNGPAANSKPSNKRAHGSGGPPWNSGAHPPRPAKTQKFPSSYPTSYGQPEVVSRPKVVSRPLSPVSKYLGSSYCLSSQTAYDPSLTAPSPSRYSATHILTAGQIAQQHYAVPSGSAGPRTGSTYVLQSPYGVYDYGAAAASNYQPSYPQ